MRKPFNQFAGIYFASFQFGLILLLIAQAIISIQGSISSFPISSFNGHNIEFRMVKLGRSARIFSFLDILALVRRKRFQNFIWLLMMVGFAGSLLNGGGWYIGVIIGFVALHCIFFSAKGTKITTAISSNRIGAKKTAASFGILFLCLFLTLFGMAMPYSPPSTSNGPLYPGMNGPPNENNTFYIMFNGASFSNPSDQAYFQSQIGNGSSYVKIGFCCCAWYMADLNNASFNYTFNPYSDFYSELNYSVENNIPVIIDFNGGDWGMCNHNTNLTYNAWLNASEIQWDQFNDYPAAQSNVGGLTDRLFCLDNNTQIYAYRHMNVKIAADIVKDFADQYPNLFVGVSTDSEIHLATADSPLLLLMAFNLCMIIIPA